MSIENLANSAAVFALPLRSRFRDTDVRYGALFEGPAGWAEFAPFPEYSDEVAGRWLAGALEQAFGIWPTPVRSSVPVNAIIPTVDLETTRALVAQAITNGMTTIKIKVGDKSAAVIDDDRVRIAVIREVLDASVPHGVIRIDANATWSLDQALDYLPELDAAAGGLDYVEQPCATFEELHSLREAIRTWDRPVRIAVDEGIRQAATLDVTAIRDVADVVVIKSLPLGGVARSLEVINQIGLPVIVSGSLDTSVGLASGIYLAASIDNLAGACGLGTGTLFANDVVIHPLVPTNGSLPVGRVIPDPDLLSKTKPTDQIVTDWRERIVRAWETSAKELVSEQVREAVTR